MLADFSLFKAAIFITRILNGNGSIQYIFNENRRATRLVLSQSKLDLGKVETLREENPLNISFIVETFLSFFRKTKVNRFAL